MTVVLASASPRRRVLLGFLVPEFVVRPADVNESLADGPLIEALEALAARKAAAVPGPVVLAADTEVITDGQVQGKPNDLDHTRRLLMRSGNHDVVTAVAVRGPNGTHTNHAVTRVDRNALPDDVLEQYLKSGAWQDKAGGFGIQDRLISPHVRIDGSWSNVVGLPLELTATMLATAGVTVRDPPLEEDLAARNPF